MSEDNPVYVEAEAYSAKEMYKFSHLGQSERERIRLSVMCAYCAAYAAAMTHAKQIYSSTRQSVS